MRTSTLALALACLPCATAQAQRAAAPPPREVSFFGRRYDGFRQLFSLKGLPLGTREEFARDARRENAARWIVVALGKPEAAGVPEGFLERGGSLLAATDGASEAFGQLGVRFMAGPVIVDGPQGPTDCPVTGGFARRHELFAGVRQVAFNRAGCLELNAAGTVQKLAWFPDEARLNEAPAPFLTAMGATLDSRRALFVSDQSVFINEMFLDANRRPLNARFCANVVDWLVGGRDPAELKVLFLEDGEPIGEWIDPRYLEGRWPQNPLEEKLDFFDELMKAMEKYVLDLEKRTDPDTKLPLFEQWMQNLENRAAPGTYIRWAILAASMLLAFVVARWMLQWSPIRAKALKEPKPPIEAKPHFLERRRRELLEGGHYVELARRMSRMWLERRFGGSASAGAPPEIEFVGGYWQRREARRTWRKVLDLAAGKPADPLTYREFERFRTEMDALTRSLPRKRVDSATGEARPS